MSEVDVAPEQTPPEVVANGAELADSPEVGKILKSEEVKKQFQQVSFHLGEAIFTQQKAEDEAKRIGLEIDRLKQKQKDLSNNYAKFFEKEQAMKKEAQPN